ncbi:RNA polymerase sigma factor [Ralstonia sp. SET104]|uniref:RNA polymerase sigma factor n=1 Tax=Ralstonia sp. SET104 TaxID=2448774 RepID=UPI000F575C71|nr:RNA polymerase sigma factor [Ralstonia sp. SET104]GCB05227.1 RNA polymerase sigma factor [Ralstonia sp. SET104]
MNTQHQTPAPISSLTTETELVSRAAQGDEAAFEAIMRRHNRLLFRTARSILKSDLDAEEALQEAYLRAWRALEGFRSDAKLSTWLVRIVANEALGRLRRKVAQVIPLDAAMNSIEPEIQSSLTDDPDYRPENLVMRAQMRKLLEARIDMLPETFRAVFMLRAVEEMSVEEVSQALDIPEATVRTRFFRARSMLREGLASQVDVALNDAFAFAGARCDRIVAGVLARANAEGLVSKG